MPFCVWLMDTERPWPSVSDRPAKILGRARKSQRDGENSCWKRGSVDGKLRDHPSTPQQERGNAPSHLTEIISLLFRKPDLYHMPCIDILIRRIQAIHGLVRQSVFGCKEGVEISDCFFSFLVVAHPCECLAIAIAFYIWCGFG